MKNTFISENKTKKDLADFILSAAHLSMGAQCFSFEEEFASFQNMKHAILFNSGGSANLAIIQTLKNMGKLKEGDRVAFSGLTWSTNVMPIIQLGLEPVPVDCNELTLNVMSNELQNTIERENIKAFFATNVLGFAGDLGNIKRICDDNNVIFLEDNCESLGTEINNTKTGSFGEMSSFSFFVAHHMSTIEGGMVCTNNSDFAEMLRIVRANGWDRNLDNDQQKKWRDRHNVESEFYAKYTFYDLGYNLRPTEITGFLGRSQLKFLNENIKKREENYLNLERFILENDDLISPDRNHISLLSNFSFPVICRTESIRDLYFDRFLNAEVEVRPMIAGNIQNQPFYKKYLKKSYYLPNVDKLDKNSFYFGNYPELTGENLQTFISCLTK